MAQYRNCFEVKTGANDHLDDRVWNRTGKIGTVDKSFGGMEDVDVDTEDGRSEEHDDENINCPGGRMNVSLRAHSDDEEDVNVDNGDNDDDDNGDDDKLLGEDDDDNDDDNDDDDKVNMVHVTSGDVAIGFEQEDTGATDKEKVEGIGVTDGDGVTIKVVDDSAIGLVGGSAIVLDARDAGVTVP